MNDQPPCFNVFVAIDWSGARGPRLPGLQMACCRPGSSAPRLLRPKTERHWTRTSVWQTVTAEARRNGPVLAAFDMGLGLPFVDHRMFFPGLTAAPRTARQLWQAVDRYSGDAPDYYAGPFCHPPSPFARYFNAPGYRGDAFDSSRQRLTEQICQKWTRPSSVFNGVGAGSVGMGSLAGMRLLHHIRKPRDLRVAIWPFDSLAGADIVVVEMFPRLYPIQGGLNPKEWWAPSFLPSILRHYGVRSQRAWPTHTEDEVDALFSAAAIRDLSKRPNVWQPTAMTRSATTHEGWIFGVT